LGEPFFNDKLNPICISWLNDSIFSIREAAVKNLKELTLIFGIGWASTKALPKLMSLHVESNYLHRLTPLFAMTAMASCLNHEVIKKQFIPVIFTLTSDRVPNIRMNVAKTI